MPGEREEGKEAREGRREGKSEVFLLGLLRRGAGKGREEKRKVENGRKEVGRVKEEINGERKENI